MGKTFKKDYFNFPRLISIIFAIIPITSLIFGIVTRLKEGHIFCAILRILLGWNIIWILDLILIILNGHILKLFN